MQRIHWTIGDINRQVLLNFLSFCFYWRPHCQVWIDFFHFLFLVYSLIYLYLIYLFIYLHVPYLSAHTSMSTKLKIPTQCVLHTQTCIQRIYIEDYKTYTYRGVYRGICKCGCLEENWFCRNVKVKMRKRTRPVRNNYWYFIVIDVI